MSGDLCQRIAAVLGASIAEEPCARIGGAIREAFRFLPVNLRTVQSWPIRAGSQGIVVYRASAAIFVLRARAA